MTTTTMTTTTMTTTTRMTAAPRSTTHRAAAFVLACAMSALTLVLATPGGAVYVAGRILPGAGNAFETIAMQDAIGATEVDILPRSVDVVGVRANRTASEATPAQRG